MTGLSIRRIGDDIVIIDSVQDWSQVLGHKEVRVKIDAAVVIQQGIPRSYVCKGFRSGLTTSDLAAS